MPTAIFGKYVRGGFVLASDGRSTAEDGSIISDNVRKIFTVDYPGRLLAYAVMGFASIVEEDSGKGIIDLATEISLGATLASSERSDSLAGFVTRISKPINRILKTARETGKITSYPSAPIMFGEKGETIARVIFIGYFNGEASQVTVRFFHTYQVLQKPEILTIPPLHQYVYGSQAISNLIDYGDPRFEKYRVAVSDIDDGSDPLESRHHG